MTQEKAAEIIEFSTSREVAGVDEAPSAGAFLASVRKAAGFSLFAVSDATKVKIEHLEAIEANDVQALPIAAYAIGFVKSYARFLDLDEDAIARKFKKDIGADEVMSSAAVPRSTEAVSASPHISEGARMVSIFGIIAILSFAFWIIFQVTNSPGNRVATGATSAPEQRVRLGNAPLPTLTPRQSSTENTEVSAVEPTVENDVPISDVSTTELAASDTSALVGSSADNDATAVISENQTIENADASAPVDETAQTEPEQNPVAEVIAETQPAVDEPAELVPSTSTLITEPVDGPPVSTVAAAPELDTPVVENIDAAIVAAATRPRTQIEQIIPEPVIVEAKLLRSMAPQYPNRCVRNAADLERVTVLFDVTVQGRPANLRVANTSNSCFDSAAISTLRRWRFEPKTVDGAARVDLAKSATLNFRR